MTGINRTIHFPSTFVLCLTSTYIVANECIKSSGQVWNRFKWHSVDWPSEESYLEIAWDQMGKKYIKYLHLSVTVWGTECLNTSFLQSTLLFPGYSVKLFFLNKYYLKV